MTTPSKVRPTTRSSFRDFLLRAPDLFLEPGRAGRGDLAHLQLLALSLPQGPGGLGPCRRGDRHLHGFRGQPVGPVPV
ncbi:hypothetical protein ACRAWD_01535 [Caulobacter segnis]